MGSGDGDPSRTPPRRGSGAVSAPAWRPLPSGGLSSCSSGPPVPLALVGLERGDGFQVADRALGPVFADDEDPAVPAGGSPEQGALGVLPGSLGFHDGWDLE